MLSLTKSEELASGRSLGFNGLLLAMSHWQLGQKDDARKWFHRSIQWMEQKPVNNAELIGFRAETEKLLDIPRLMPHQRTRH